MRRYHVVPEVPEQTAADEKASVAVDQSDADRKLFQDAAQPRLAVAHTLVRSFSIGDIECDSGERDGSSLVESRQSARGDPPLDAVGANDPIFDVVDAALAGIDAEVDRRQHPTEIFGMHMGPPDFVVDMGVRRQSPHHPHAGVPVDLVRLRIPVIEAEAQQVGGGA